MKNNLEKQLPLILFILFSVSSAFSQNESNAFKAENDPGYVIPFVLTNSKVILPVTVPGVARPLKIILDSGMGWNGILIMNPDLKDSVRMKNSFEANVGGGGGSRSSTAVVSDSMGFAIGPLQLVNQRMVMLQGENFRGFPTDGVTGYSLFGHYAVEVNYDRSHLVLHEQESFLPDESWTPVPIYFREFSIPWIDAYIIVDNSMKIPVSCYIDFASSEAIELLIKPDQKYIIPEMTKDVYLGRGLSGDINGKRGEISKVFIGPYELSQVTAAFVPAATRSKLKGADGIVSGNLLRRFNLVFDYAHEKLYLKPNSSFEEPFQ